CPSPEIYAHTRPRDRSRVVQGVSKFMTPFAPQHSGPWNNVLHERRALQPSPWCRPMSRKFARHPLKAAGPSRPGNQNLTRFFPPALQRSALCEFSSISTFPIRRLMQPLEMALLVRNLVALLTK